MAETVTKDNEMPVFIQALYGVILGVGFLQGKDILQQPLDWGALYQLLFFLLSMFIVAHDWYIYHSVPVKRPGKFWYYGFQIGSMFFLSQMVIVAADMSIGYGNIDWWESVKSVSNKTGFKKEDWQLESEIKGKGFWALLKIPVIQWYVFGIFYTLCNFFNLRFINQPEKLRRVSFSNYLFHLAICGIAFFLLTYFHFTEEVCFAVLLGTIVLVIVFWQRRENKANAIQEKAGPFTAGKLKVKVKVKLSDGDKNILRRLIQEKVKLDFTTDEVAEVEKRLEIILALEKQTTEDKNKLKETFTGKETFIDSIVKGETDKNYKKAIAGLFN